MTTRWSERSWAVALAGLLALHGQARGFTLGLTFAASALVLGAVIYAGSAPRWRHLP